MFLKPVVLAMVILGLARGNDEVDLQSGINRDFPYFNCDRDPRPYGLAPVMANGTNRFCFRVVVNTTDCNSPCCRANLYKIELDVKPECKVPGARVNVTVNDAPVPFQPDYLWAPGGTGEAAMLRVSGLTLNTTTANGAEICIILIPNKSGGGCTTLDTLCRTPAGCRPGTCRVALIDSSFDCCPINNTTESSPPPPPSQPSVPSQPPPPCTRRLCASLRITKTPLFGPEYTFSNTSCATYQQQMANSLNPLLSGLGVLTSSFTGTSEQCQPTEISVCGNISVPIYMAATVQNKLDNEAINFVQNTVKCSANTGEYRFSYESDIGQCGTFQHQKDCDVVDVPFPFCKCDKANGVPLSVNPVVISGPSPNAKYSAHCFKFENAPSIPLGSCNGSLLHKVEFWAEDTSRSNVGGFQLIPSNGTLAFRSPSWAGLGTDTLKATTINWTMQQADGGMICILVKKEFPLSGLCNKVDPNACFLSIFDVTRTCCTTFRVQLVHA